MKEITIVKQVQELTAEAKSKVARRSSQHNYGDDFVTEVVDDVIICPKLSEDKWIKCTTRAHRGAGSSRSTKLRAHMRRKYRSTRHSMFRSRQRTKSIEL